jgi:hypothetical protein
MRFRYPAYGLAPVVFSSYCEVNTWLQAAPSKLFLCELGTSACFPGDARPSSNDTLFKQFIGTVSAFPANSTWSLLQQGYYGARKQLAQPAHDLSAVTNALSHFQQATWLDSHYVAAQLESVTLPSEWCPLLLVMTCFSSLEQQAWHSAVSGTPVE